MFPDPPTLAYYEAHATEVAGRYAATAGGVSIWLDKAFPGSLRVLDVGCGTGRDLCELLRRGHDAHGTDASRAMLAAAANACRAAGFDPEGRLIADTLPDLATCPDAAFDGVLCSAVLMHLPDKHLFDAVYALRRILRPAGRLLLSIPASRPDVDPVTRRDPSGRLFSLLPPAKIKLLFERVGFRLLAEHLTDDSLGRPGHCWTSLIFENLGGDATRPLDQVESILNRDKKDATYKLALFRALADVAQTQYNLAAYDLPGRVSIPIRALADRWLVYYWPLVASPTFIAQKYGECPGGAKPIAIRAPLRRLIDTFGEEGGLSAFQVALKSGDLAPAVRQAHREAIRVIASTIWNMPVRFAGGGGDFSVLGYDRKQRRVTLPEGLWRELTLTGSWIQDATVLRWAELTERLSKKQTPFSAVIEKLLSGSDPERETRDARLLFARMGVDKCVWSDRALRGHRFDVDHVIPFVLWHNNDLWNLLPAHPVTNNAKRDQLPTQRLLRRRRDTVIGYWEILRDAHVERFDREAAGLCGLVSFKRGDWKDVLFGRLAEAIEVTAVQRCVPRWEPELASDAVSFVPLAPIRTDPRASDAVRPTTNSARRRPFLTGEPPAAHRLPLVASLAASTSFFDGFATGSLDDVADVEWVEVPVSICRPKRFVVRVAGDSMEPLFRVGDLLIFDYHRTPRRDGEIVIAADFTAGGSGGSYAIKRYQAHPDNWVFRSENPAYAPVEIPKTETPYPILGTFAVRLEGKDWHCRCR
jgi:phage repressor protein C with HTH and peptisase S24 domain/SAM-dependent methyltransferase